MAKATQFCVGLENKPGTMAKLCAALARAKVNIDAISVSENVEYNWVRLVASPAAAARKALAKAGFDYCTQQVLQIRIPNRPGQLEKVATRLGKAGVNMNYLYGSNAAGASSTVIISVNDVDRAAKLVS